MLRRYIKDNVTDADSTLFSGMIGFPMNRAPILVKKNPYNFNENIFLLKKGHVFPILSGGTWKTFYTDADVELSESDLDTPGGTFEVGRDYSLYLVDDGADGQAKFSPRACSHYAK